LYVIYIIGEKSVELSDGSVYSGKHILIATGGKPRVPTEYPGAELGITSDGFFELEDLPKLVI
jgi:glutathione reductase (NADPH)